MIGTAVNSDLNCKVINANGVCEECFHGYYLSENNCIEINQLCKSADSKTGDCLTCYNGYILSRGQCRIPEIG